MTKFSEGAAAAWDAATKPAPKGYDCRTCKHGFGLMSAFPCDTCEGFALYEPRATAPGIDLDCMTPAAPVEEGPQPPFAPWTPEELAGLAGEPVDLAAARMVVIDPLNTYLGATAALPDDNPKTRFGVAKPPLHLIPATALAHEATAFRDGAKKYGPYNWREQAVSSTTYVAAAERHLKSWFNREENAQDSGVHHLAHARACLAILIDAQEVGKLNDDRPPAADLQGLYDRLTVPMA